MEKKTGYPQLWITEGGLILEGEASETEDGLIDSLKWNKGASDAKHDDAHVEQGGFVNAHHAPISTKRVGTNGGLHQFVAVGAENRFQHGLLARRRVLFAAVHRLSQLSFNEKKVIIRRRIRQNE